MVIPTKNEAGNVGPLLERLEQTLDGVDAEIVFVDDSDDETPRVAARLGARSGLPVRVIGRAAGERTGGLAGAVVAGFRAARGAWLCVMDADLQHPPEVIERLLDRAARGDVDVVVASRYCSEGAATALGPGRSLFSRGSTTVAHLLFPRRLRDVSDPMSGFFLVRRASLELDRLEPEGFKILLELLVSHGTLRRAEVPFRFGRRSAGESKASLWLGAIYLSQLTRLRLGGRTAQLVRFSLAGAVGLVVNTAVFALLAAGIGLNYLLAALLATQASTLSNFVLGERWVFAGRAGGDARPRAAAYFLMNNAALLLRGPMLVLLVTHWRLDATVANLLSLVALTLLRFAVADTVIWRSARRKAPHGYALHGLVTVVSDVILPELEAFRVEQLPQQPDIRVRIGRLSRRQSEFVQTLLYRTRHLRYDEGLGALGFAVELSAGRTFEILASPLLRRSPHVLYTNVVEPVLRWTFVKHGYALVHAACIAEDGQAMLITAKTDTGKTTTILKVLDSSSYEFLSDDLTLIDRHGHVLSYPKPLTISRHTARAVKAPLLRPDERIRLVYQSRIHSRSGRRFAQIVARLRLPAATINALVQWVVPPPKYHVQRLVPDVTLAGEARVTRMHVIERGGRGEERLEPHEAIETLLANSEDAFGFPPYPAIAPFLYRHGGRDLRLVEKEIVGRALAGVPVSTLRSETMDWWTRLGVVDGPPPAAVARPENVLGPMGPEAAA